MELFELALNFVLSILGGINKIIKCNTIQIGNNLKPFLPTVVVVGMDKDPTGRLIFRFYDNYTSDPEFGAHPLNIVTYDPITGSLTGSWVGTKSHLPIFYKVAQIRKSYK